METSKSFERRDLLREQVRSLHRRNWQLWATSLLSTFALAVALAALFYPVLRWHLKSLEVGGGPLAQMVVGLLILVILESAYLISKQHELNELREYLISLGCGAVLAVDFPTDTLTGALSRSALSEILERERAWADRFGISLSLLLLDIRGFTALNKTRGNLTGDLVLKGVANTLKATTRQSDTVMRYGADEFLCVLPRTDLAGAKGLIRRIRQAAKATDVLKSIEMDYGLAVYQYGPGADRLLAEAEEDLARAKREARAPEAEPAPALPAE